MSCKIIMPKTLSKFPSQDSSKMILNKFLTAPVIGQEYYFEDDMQLHGTCFTEIRFYFYGGALADFYIGQHFKTDSIQYNTIGFSDMRNMLITFRDEAGNFLIDSQPCAGFTSNFGSVNNLKFNKYRRRFMLKGVSLKNSSVQFTSLPLTALPFVVPFQIKYR